MVKGLTRSGPLHEHFEHLLFDLIETADARAQNCAATVGIFFAEIQTGISNSVEPSIHCKECETIKPFHILCFYRRTWIEVRDIARRIELCDVWYR